MTPEQEIAFKEIQKIFKKYKTAYGDNCFERKCDRGEVTKEDERTVDRLLPILWDIDLPEDNLPSKIDSYLEINYYGSIFEPDLIAVDS